MHFTIDGLCHAWCNPLPRDGSAPNLVIPAVEKNGQPCFKQAFNTQVSYLQTFIDKSSKQY